MKRTRDLLEEREIGEKATCLGNVTQQQGEESLGQQRVGIFYEVYRMYGQQLLGTIS